LVFLIRSSPLVWTIWFMSLKDKNLKSPGHRTPPLQITFPFQCLEVIESRSGIDIKVYTDLPYRRRITSLFDKCSNEVEDLSLSGCQFHNSPFNSTPSFYSLCSELRTHHSELGLKILYICLVVKRILEISEKVTE
jgi:hypothetical protein